MPKAFHIDVVAQTIKPVECSGFREMQLLIGGPIEAASHLPTGDVLFVDEEGLLKRPPGFFMFALRPDQPLASNGLVVGRERYDREGNFLGQDDPRITLAQLRELVRFVDRAFVDSWGKANSSEAASSFTILQEDGTLKREVLAQWGKVIGDLPKDPESEEDK